VAGASQKLFDLADDGVHVANAWHVVNPFRLDHPRASNVLGEVPGALDRNCVTDAMQNQRRDVNVTEDGAQNRVGT
jgi:hypothetical protein